jgi:hypothetical protein
MALQLTLRFTRQFTRDLSREISQFPPNFAVFCPNCHHNAASRCTYSKRCLKSPSDRISQRESTDSNYAVTTAEHSALG